MQATRIAYGRNNDFRRVVTLDGALFEKSGTMSGGGSKPRGGKMGTSIRASSVSTEAVSNAEKELSGMVDSLNTIRQRILDAGRRYQASEKAVTALEMELAKAQKEVMLVSDLRRVHYFLMLSHTDHFLFQQVDSLNSQHSYIEKQLASLEAASQPKTDELNRLKQLQKIIATEELEINKLNEGSKQLKEEVGWFFVYVVPCRVLHLKPGV